MKELKIEIPEGHEVDEDKSTFLNIIFKPIAKKCPTKLSELKSTKTLSTIFYIKMGVVHKALPHCKQEESGNFESAELANAFIILADLIRFRDEYRDGWKPDWADNTWKYFIYNHNPPPPPTSWRRFGTFSFQSKEIRDIFLKNFRPQLEILIKNELL